jgi:hypothetical protein
MSSSRATRGTPVVERRYAPSPDACARAVAVLLKHPVRNSAGTSGGEDTRKRDANDSDESIAPTGEREPEM